MAKVIKCIYGHPEAGYISYGQLVAHLKQGGYIPTPHTPALFKHFTNNLKFILVIDSFGIKFTNRADAQNFLVNHLKKQYTVREDWNGSLSFCGITLNWDYNRCTIELSMPNYVNKALLPFHHPTPTKPEHSPHA